MQINKTNESECFQLSDLLSELPCNFAGLPFLLLFVIRILYLFCSRTVIPSAMEFLCDFLMPFSITNLHKCAQFICVSQLFSRCNKYRNSSIFKYVVSKTSSSMIHILRRKKMLCHTSSKRSNLQCCTEIMNKRFQEWKAITLEEKNTLNIHNDLWGSLCWL